MKGTTHTISELKRMLSLIMLSIFLYSSTPRSLLHEAFANHKDTIDKPLHNQHEIGPRHVHCLFMHMHLAPYTPPTLQITFINTWIQFSFQPSGYSLIYAQSLSIQRLRAPPVLTTA